MSFRVATRAFNLSPWTSLPRAFSRSTSSTARPAKLPFRSFSSASSADKVPFLKRLWQAKWLVTSPIATNPIAQRWPRSGILQAKVEPCAFTKMLGNSSQRDLMEERIARLPERSDKVSELVKALENTDALVINDEELLYAIEALRQAKITSQQLASLGIFLAVYKSHQNEVKSYGLFAENGKAQIAAWKMIGEALGGILSEEEMWQFVDQMKLLPRSEQRFLVVPYACYIKKFYFKFVRTNGIRHAINRFSNLLSAFTWRDQQLLMIPSVGIQQTFLDVFAGSRSVKINPIFGASSLTGMRLQALSNKRDMSIPSTWISLPSLADGHSAPSYDFPYHDFYHAFVVSCASLKFRQLFIAIADTLDVYQLQRDFVEFRNTQLVQQIHSLKSALIDMELGQMHFYRCAQRLASATVKDISEDDVFWADLIQQVSHWIALYQVDSKVLEKVIDQLIKPIVIYQSQTENSLDARILEIFKLDLADRSDQKLTEMEENGQISAFFARYRKAFKIDFAIGKLVAESYWRALKS